jgi:hypothetical protein
MTGAVSTVDSWRDFSSAFAFQQAIAGVYGVDFRTPEPTAQSRRALRMLGAVNELEPGLLKQSANAFDWDVRHYVRPQTSSQLLLHPIPLHVFYAIGLVVRMVVQCLKCIVIREADTDDLHLSLRHEWIA